MSTDLHTLSGAYALDALSPDEAGSFARHLEECPSCSEEVSELQHAAARMGASEAARPPSALRARVLAAADHQPQLPPQVTPIGVRHPRRWTARIVGAAAAVILVVTAGIGVSQLRQQDEPPVASASVSQVFAADDAHVATVRTTDGHTLMVATSADSGQLAIDTRTLAPLSDERVYQIWGLHNGRATSIGVVKDIATGAVTTIPTFGTSMAITVEPPGGSRQPTTTPIVTMDPQAI